MPRISIGDGSLYYERQGVGFPVLFISGLGGFASFWQDQVAASAKQFDVITHDHRGIGQSDPTRSGFTVERMAPDVIGLMDALEIERAHVVGHSTGGAIAQILAIEHPNRLGAVVLSATWTKPDAYFRRLFKLRKDILLRLGPSAYLQAQHALSSIRAGGSRGTTSGCASWRRRTSRCSRRPISPPAASTRSSPSTAPRASARSRPRPWWSAPRTTSSRRRISPRSSRA